MENNHEDEIVEIKQKHAEDRQKLKEQYEKYLAEQEKVKAEKNVLENLLKEAEKAMLKS